MANNLESLDTNVLLRMILEDGTDLSKRAERMLERDGVKYLILDQVIIEMVYILDKQKNYKREYIADIIVSLFNRHNIEFNDFIFSNVIPLYVNHPKLSFVDCYLATVVEQKEAMPLWTFDKKLALQSEVAKEVE
jgi:predicted nucleic-acid-binding protein